MKTKMGASPTTPFEVSSEALEKFGQVFADAAARGQSMIESGLKNWETEVERYYDEVSAQSQKTFEALGKCNGPLEVLSVEQEWLKARAQAYYESGMRFAKAFAEIARQVPVHAAEPPAVQPKG